MMSPSAPDEAATSPLRRNYPLLEQRYPAANAAARVSFALSFLALRVVGWWPVCLPYLRDLWALAPDEPVVVKRGVRRCCMRMRPSSLDETIRCACFARSAAAPGRLRRCAGRFLCSV